MPSADTAVSMPNSRSPIPPLADEPTPSYCRNSKRRLARARGGGALLTSHPWNTRRAKTHETTGRHNTKKKKNTHIHTEYL